MIKMSPTNAEKKSYLRELRQNAREHYDKFDMKMKRTHFRVGDKVKIILDRGRFGRGYQDIFSSEIYTIDKINFRKAIPMHSLKDFAGDSLRANFYSEEMQKVGDVRVISSFLGEKKKINARTHVLVRWEDGGQDWVDEEQIANIKTRT
jgi:hypothetical protein